MLADALLQEVKNIVEDSDIDLWDTMWCDSDKDYEFEGPFVKNWRVGHVRVGATKLCLFLRYTPSMVVKIPFLGAVDEGFSSGTEFKRANLCYKKFASNTWDYCLTECGLFQEARRLGIDKCFAGTYYIGSIDNYPIYASVKIPNCFCDCGESTSTKQSMELGKKIIASKPTSFGDITPNLLGLFIDSYGYDVAKRLFDFIDKYGIRDFHDGNIARMDSGEIKIIDYSGYNESIYL